MDSMKEMSPHWNYRILAFEEDNNEIFFAPHEVYYDDKGNPKSYHPIGFGSDTIQGMKWQLSEIMTAVSMIGSPRKKYKILYGGEKFPREYKPKKDEKRKRTVRGR